MTFRDFCAIILALLAHFPTRIRVSLLRRSPELSLFSKLYIRTGFYDWIRCHCGERCTNAIGLALITASVQIMMTLVRSWGDVSRAFEIQISLIYYKISCEDYLIARHPQ